MVEKNKCIEIKSLNYSIKQNDILSDINLQAREGVITGVIGPNGSGKTTLLKHVYRAIVPDRNVVFLQGKDVHDLSYRNSARMMSVMKQESGSDFEFSLIDMVLLGRSPYLKYYEGYSREDVNIAEKALEAVGLGDEKKRLFSTLSGGEKQRVLLARSIAQQTDILLLDEPTNHLDVHYQWKLMDMLKELNKTIIAVFHELNIACKYCSYLYVLADGHIITEGRPEDIITSDLLRSVFRINAEVYRDKNMRPYVVFNGAV